MSEDENKKENGSAEIPSPDEQPKQKEKNSNQVEPCIFRVGKKEDDLFDVRVCRRMWVSEHVNVDMKSLIFILVLFSGKAFAADAICFDDNNSFSTQAPDGWVADFNQAKQLGLCVVYYMKGSTFDSSPAIIYPRLMTTTEQGDKAITKIISEDTERLKMKGASNLKVTEQAKMKNANGLEFQIRHFSNGPAPNEFEAVSYHAGKKAVLLSVFSTRSKDAFEKHNGKLNEFVGSIKPISKEELKKYKK